MRNKVYFTFLGTTQHRDRDQNLLLGIHDLVEKHAKTEGGENVAAYLFDGVGCVGTKENPTPGTYYPIKVNGKAKKCAQNLDLSSKDTGVEEPDSSTFPEIKKQVVKFYNALTLRLTRYRLTGEGVDSLLLEATSYLESLIEQNNGKMPLEINLNGFSRGADTCVRLAHILEKLCPETKVNLFLVDPVPGPGRYDDEDSYIIPRNVENSHIIVMANEHMSVVKPRDIDSYVFTNMATKVKYNILPGNHSSGILRKPGKKVGSDESYKLVQDALLNDNIKRGLLPSNTQIDKEYGLIDKKCVVKDLSLDRDYIIFNASHITGDISYAEVKKRIKDKTKDVLFLHRGNLYHLDRSFKNIRKIEQADLSEFQKNHFNFWKKSIGRIRPAYYRKINLNKDSIRSLVLPPKHKILDNTQEFSIYCKALLDFNKKSERAEVAVYHSRDAKENRSRRIRCHALFLDEGHRSSFIKLFPNLNGWFFKADETAIEESVIDELQELKEINPIYAKKFAQHFKFDLDAAIKTGQVIKSNKYPSYFADGYGKELGCDSLSYLRASLRNIVNLYKHKPPQSEADKELILKIKKKLDETFDLPENQALAELNSFIANINTSKENGAICHEIIKIIYKPEEQYEDFIKFIREVVNSSDLEEGHKLILLSFFEKEINNKDVYFTWEKYVTLREKAITLQASLADYNDNHVLEGKAITAYSYLSQKLTEFYSVDYGIPTATDLLISKLRSYQRWAIFYSYFPKVLGFFDKEKYEKIDKFINMLTDMPPAAKNDLFTLRNVLDEKIRWVFAIDDTSSLSRQRGGFSLLNRYLFNILNNTMMGIKNICSASLEEKTEQRLANF